MYMKYRAVANVAYICGKIPSGLIEHGVFRKLISLIIFHGILYLFKFKFYLQSLTNRFQTWLPNGHPWVWT